MKRAAVFCLLAVSVVRPVVAQAPAADKPKKIGWSNAAELSYVLTSGNAETRTLALRDTLTHVWQSALFSFEAGALRASADTKTVSAVGLSPDDFVLIENSDTRVTAANYFLRSRYDRNLSTRFLYFVGGGWDRNVPAGIQDRVFATAGVGNVWFDDESGKLRTDYGLSVTNQDDVIESPGVARTFAGLRASADYARKVTGNTKYNFLAIADESLSSGDDLRLDVTNALAVAMTEKLALKVALRLLFDNQPARRQTPLTFPDALFPPTAVVSYPLDKLDTFFTVALVITY